MQYFSNGHEDCPNQHKKSYKENSEKGDLHLSWKKRLKTDKSTRLEFPSLRNATDEKILVSEDIDEYKRATL